MTGEPYELRINQSHVLGSFALLIDALQALGRLNMHQYATAEIWDLRSGDTIARRCYSDPFRESCSCGGKIFRTMKHSGAFHLALCGVCGTAYFVRPEA